ncbi:MAG: zinc metallopeptidase [Hyphomicrobiaceae bacterium]|nr:zinc metallopeptidase [Hyphomicrobiaceae bacterium]
MVRWRGRRESDNVEDRRGESGSGGFPFPMGRGGRVRFPFPGRGGGGGRRGGIGIVGLLVILGLMLFFGVDPRVILQGGQQPGSSPDIQMPDIRLPGGTKPSSSPQTGGGRQVQAPKSKNDDALKRYVTVILADTEDIWNRLFKQMGRQYREPTLVIFSGATRSGCGVGMAAMGPFYCPLDQKLYIDLDFYKEMKNRFGASGDFAQAYVIAHEVGHHVQTLLGISEKVQRAKSRMSQKQGNALQVRMELQADCLAGVWANLANRSKNILEPGDVEEGLNAASAIGDDNIQRRTQGHIVPDAFTHGTSKQRVRWFKRGLDSGDIQQCDTFNARSL